MEEKNYVWYASYGSNLSRDRFLCYIRGGKPEGSEIEEVGCRDQSLPIKEASFIMDYPLYFAKNSDRWQNGGVAFIGLQQDLQTKTYSKKYLITEEQFFDVVKQENNGAEFEINLDEAKKEGSKTFRDAWYGTILYVGEADGHPIFTFTADWDLDVPFSKPSKHYLRMIREGLKTTAGLSNQEVVDYFLTKPGVKDNYSSEELTSLLT
ncbi:hypothetical protein DS745_22020 [Anaerobacillus alkaliphilus]|uniref:Histone deacetylase n=1 Tax=Anaerobacillus alkaliphilus TaxID=1548597 RepID=A0A4Q0VMX4_9BACI|nr:hypothetical protein [Anaerobacillus alkaliphilus]RXI96394.1 hypothetical protein DS745_22020 [Anaerobacillus alkaliphilus]